MVEYAWRNGRADVWTRRLVLFVRQPHQNHNGGNLAFGPDGNLYIGLGDGGSDANFGPDPHNNGQNLGVLLVKMLRIEPRPRGGKPYGIPSGNPLAGRRQARPEIWAYGLRNPWRYSFDRQTGDLCIADVGGGAEEEVDLQQAGSSGGQNYGWSRLEGTRILENPPPPPPNAVSPVYEYNHMAGGCAIRGGYVYPGGNALPDLPGWCSVTSAWGSSTRSDSPTDSRTYSGSARRCSSSPPSGRISRGSCTHSRSTVACTSFSGRSGVAQPAERGSSSPIH